uniref:Uncharacterized protein n=1 Tax=Oryza rufipogon TaxID=4529 RepID=A0A0E0Q7F1_ORYRU
MAANFSRSHAWATAVSLIAFASTLRRAAVDNQNRRRCHRESIRFPSPFPHPKPIRLQGFDTILNSEFNDISGAQSAGGGGQVELQKGTGKKACSCGSSQRQRQPGGGRWQRQGGIISITNV